MLNEWHFRQFWRSVSPLFKNIKRFILWFCVNAPSLPGISYLFSETDQSRTRVSGWTRGGTTKQGGTREWQEGAVRATCPPERYLIYSKLWVYLYAVYCCTETDQKKLHISCTLQYNFTFVEWNIIISKYKGSRYTLQSQAYFARYVNIPWKKSQEKYILNK